MGATSKQVSELLLKSWLSGGVVDRSVGDGLMFVAAAASARLGKASWILRSCSGGLWSP